MPAARICLAILCLAAILCVAGCAPSGAEPDETVHYGYTGSLPAVCAACEE